MLEPVYFFEKPSAMESLSTTLLQDSLVSGFDAVRQRTEAICAPLAIEDYVVQAMDDVSPAKWHLAHTTWFFEEMLLLPFLQGYKRHNERYPYLFNSYYINLGDRWQRSMRGNLSRPTVKEVYAYRHAVDDAMRRLLSEGLSALAPERAKQMKALAVLGMNHEQQHQELLLTDIKYNLVRSPLHPVYQVKDGSDTASDAATGTAPLHWVAFDGGQYTIGKNEHDGGFSYDNEGPAHEVLLQPFALANRLVTNGEYLEFVLDEGYERPELWLDEGWTARKEHNWFAPEYWLYQDGTWHEMTLLGLCPLNLLAPVTHLSLYEAEAYATWRGLRLPTEAEWEVAAKLSKPTKERHAFVEGGLLHPTAVATASDSPAALQQMHGHLWQWTASAYRPYPGYQRQTDALGEYNGKFMMNQMVLRGGSLATPHSHYRPTYRNFFHPDKRWQFTGLRLAKDIR